MTIKTSKKKHVYPLDKLKNTRVVIAYICPERIFLTILNVV